MVDELAAGRPRLALDTRRLERGMMSRLRFRTLGLAIASLVLAPITHESGAQVTPGTVTGVVRDTSGRPLSGAGVALDPEGAIRVARTDRNGRFRFEHISAGTHTLRVTWIGYRPANRAIDLPETGLQVEIRLVPLAQRLDSMKILARRTGVFGIVSAGPTLSAISGASVIVMGTRYRMSTASDGRFGFPELREGGYVIAVRRDGFQTRLIPVAVPPADAVEVVAVLDALSTKSDRMREQRLRDIESRILRHPRNTMAIIARQELTILPGSRLDEALRYAPSLYSKGLIANSFNACGLYVDGREERFLQLSDFKPEDIEMLEVYEVRACIRTTPGWGGGTTMGRNRRPGVVIYVWRKR
jgi:hypothetical protein